MEIDKEKRKLLWERLRIVNTHLSYSFHWAQYQDRDKLLRQREEIEYELAGN